MVETMDEAPSKFGGAMEGRDFYENIRQQTRRENERRAGRMG